MTWFDALLLLLALGLLVHEIRQEAGQSLLDALAALVAVHFSALLAAHFTAVLGWKPAPGMDAAPLLHAACFSVLLGACLGVSRLLHSHTRWSMDNFDFLFGIIFGVIVVISLGHAVTEITAGFTAASDGSLPDYLQNSCMTDELRSFRSYHYVLNVFHAYQTGRN